MPTSIKRKCLEIAMLCIIGCWVYAQHYAGETTAVQGKLDDDTALVVSVSSDGHYAVSTHFNGEVVLWNLQEQTARIVATHANIYSAYFIKHRPDFMWQDNRTNEVHVQAVAGQTIQQFPLDFPSYGQVMGSDLKTYFASDAIWNVYQGYGKNQRQIKSSCDMDGFLGTGKLLNMTLSNDNRHLLTSGMAHAHPEKRPITEDIADNEACIRLTHDPNRPELHPLYHSPLENVALWDTQTGLPVQNFRLNIFKTYATLSPDDQYVVSGCENSRSFVWEVKSGELVPGQQPIFGACWAIGCSASFYGGKRGEFDNQGFPPLPRDLYAYNERDDVISIKFIDVNNNYLRFNYYMPYAVLYNVHDPKPKAFLALGEEPFPNVTGYTYDEAIDTAPAANILVVGQAGHGSGIIVYHYDPKHQTLTKVWAPAGPKVYRGIKGWIQRHYDHFKDDWRWQSA